MSSQTGTRQYLAEMIGTFVLVFGGVGSAVLAGNKIGYTGVSLAFGLSLLAMVYAIGPISGCHINPAVTAGMYLCKKISARRAGFYVFFQVLGAVLAAALILLIAKGVPDGYNASQQGLGANGFGLHSPGGFSLIASFAAEVILTMFLVFTVLGATDVKSPVGFAGIAIGFVLTLIHLVGIPITNTSVNPARSIGPAVLVGGWALQQLWLFIVAPLVGAGVAAGAYTAVRVSAEIITTQEAEAELPELQTKRSEPPRAGGAAA